MRDPDETDITLIGDAAAATEDGPGSRKLNVGDGEPSKLIDEDDKVIVEGVPGRNTTTSGQHARGRFIDDVDVLEYVSTPDEVSSSFPDINSSVSVVFTSDGLVRDTDTDFKYVSSGLYAEDTVFLPGDREKEGSPFVSLGSGDSVKSSSEYSDTSDDEEETPTRFVSRPLRLKFSSISRSVHFRGTISLRNASSSLVCTNSDTCLYSRDLDLLLSLYASSTMYLINNSVAFVTRYTDSWDTFSASGELFIIVLTRESDSSLGRLLKLSSSIFLLPAKYKPLYWSANLFTSYAIYPSKSLLCYFSLHTTD